MENDKDSFQLIYQSRLFKIGELLVPGQKARMVKRLVIRHPGAVVFIPQEKDGTLLLVRQTRHAIGGQLLEFPAGTLEPEEAPLLCAQRELAEEVGRKAQEWIALGDLYPAPGFCSEKQHLYLARDLTAAQAPLDEDEDIEVVPMSVAEVEQGITQGLLKDAKSLAVFLRARLAGLL